ncbi:MAG: ATP-binding protein [Candidatus Zixiibacteriota bacterium]
MSAPDQVKFPVAEDQHPPGKGANPQGLSLDGSVSKNGKSAGPLDLDDTLAQMEAIFDQVKSAQPRLERDQEKSASPESSRVRRDDLEALLDISKAINSTLVLDDILQMVMRRAIKLLRAERGFLMLLDEEGSLQFKTAHNICKESLSKDDFRISMSIANSVAKAGKSVYTSDAQHDERYSKQKSIMELDLKSIMCVPLKSKEKIIGILYLDNSSKSNIFLQSDLYLFELFAGQTAIAIENAKLYENLLAMKIYNENVVNKTPIGIVVVDNNLKVTIANKTSQEIFKKAGWKEEPTHRSLKGVSFLDLVPPDDRTRWKKICYQVLYTGEPFEEAKSYHRFGSEEIALSLKVSPLNSHDNRILGLILVIEDITEKVIAEKYLIYSQNLVTKGEMAASIAHELNNYLTIIQSNAELLSLNVKKGDVTKLDKNSKAIAESVEMMKRFTDGMVDFSKIETKITEYNLRTLIEDLIFSLKPQKQFSGIEFETSFDPGLPALPMDVGQIQQVLLNLLNNAAEAIKTLPRPQGNINITTAYARREEMAEIRVSDTGPGIPPELLTKVFEPHFTTKKHGHGFGLVICERIIKNHKGTIQVQSTSAGTIFTVTLPTKKQEEIEVTKS